MADDDRRWAADPLRRGRGPVARAVPPRPGPRAPHLPKGADDGRLPRVAGLWARPPLVRNPVAMWKAANLARTADLTRELEELKRRKLPVVVLWGEGDKIIPRASFDALCTAIGSPGEVVSGNHSWLLADPDAFGEAMTNVMEVAKLAQRGFLNDGGEAGARGAGAAPPPRDPAPGR